jgi:hypothetical protein
MLIRTAKAIGDFMERGSRVFQADLMRVVSPGCFVVAEEIDSLLSLHTIPMPAGIKRTILLEAQRAFERLRAA